VAEGLDLKDPDLNKHYENMTTEKDEEGKVGEERGARLVIPLWDAAKTGGLLD